MNDLQKQVIEELKADDEFKITNIDNSDDSVCVELSSRGQMWPLFEHIAIDSICQVKIKLDQNTSITIKAPWTDK